MMEDLTEARENAINFIIERFVQHPRQVCMDYGTHFGFAIHMAYLHAYGTCVSVVHAFFPWMYPKAVTELNELISQKINRSGCRIDTDLKKED